MVRNGCVFLDFAETQGQSFPIWDAVQVRSQNFNHFRIGVDHISLLLFLFRVRFRARLLLRTESFKCMGISLEIHNIREERWLNERIK